MKLLITILFPFILGLGNLQEANSTKSQDYPDWVQEIIDKKPTMVQIVECFWEDEKVWKINSCVTCSDMITYVYDKDKNVICEYGGVLRENTCKEDEVLLSACKVIYKSKFKLF